MIVPPPAVLPDSVKAPLTVVIDVVAADFCTAMPPAIDVKPTLPEPNVEIAASCTVVAPDANVVRLKPLANAKVPVITTVLNGALLAPTTKVLV